MIDLEMMSAVLAALPAQARLILLGDKDQLVLGRGRRGARRPVPPRRRWPLQRCHRRLAAQHHGGRHSRRSSLDEQPGAGPAGGDAAPQPSLRRQQRHRPAGSRRQPGRHGLGAAAVDARGSRPGLVARCQPPIQLAALASMEGHVEPATASGQNRPHGYRHYLELLQRLRPGTADADAHVDWALQVLQGFNRFQLLCALRQGPFGVEGLNLLIANALHGTRPAGRRRIGWYEGRPVMVTRNDYGLGLANGDVGICLRMPDPTGTAAPGGGRSSPMRPVAMTAHPRYASAAHHGWARSSRCTR